MQFPTWIRKPALVISIVVAMASLLIACGETTKQGQTTPGETTKQGQTTSTVSFDDFMSAIHAQRQQSDAAVRQIYSLEQNNAAFQGCKAVGYDYYRNAKPYYYFYVQSNFNAWLESLASEVQNGESLNTGPNDSTWLSNALIANYAFTTWERQVNDYFTVPTNSCSQGQGGYLRATFGILPTIDIDFYRVKLSDVFSKLDSEGLKKFSDALGHFVRIPTPQVAGPSLFPTPSVNDLLGAIENSEWQYFCAVVHVRSC